MARFGFRAASSLIWGGEGGLLLHFIFSKIVVCGARFFCVLGSTRGRKACALSFNVSTREKFKVCNRYAEYFKAKVLLSL